MEQAGVLMALADSTRLHILELLVQRNYCVGVLAELLGISAPAVSQHLKVLQRAGLVSSSKIGYHTHYTVQRDVLHCLAAALEQLAAVETKPCEKQGTPCGRRGGRCCHNLCSSSRKTDQD